MKGDERKTKKQLIEELNMLRQRMADVERSTASVGREKGIAKGGEGPALSLLDKLAVGYQALDGEGHLLKVNQTWLDLFGFSGEEVIGRRFDEFLVEADIPGFEKTVALLKDRGEADDIEYRVVNKEGVSVPVSLMGRSECDGKGCVVQVHCLLTPATEQGLAEEALRASQQRYRLLFEQNLAAVYRATLSGEVLKCNRSFAHLLGFTSPDEVVSLRASVFYLDLPEHQRFMQMLRERCALRNNELCLRRKDGSQVWILQNVDLIMEVDGEIVIEGSAIDISERRQAEHALRESEEQYRMLFENANEAIVVAQDGKIQFVNPKMVEISGYSARELCSKSFMEFVHSDCRTMVMEHHRRRIEGEEIPSIYDLKVLRKDGTIRWLENNGVCITWRGRPATLNFLTDITERKQVEKRFLAYQEQLRSLASELSLAEERERRRLAGQLHDGIGQSLAVTKVKLGALKAAVEGAEFHEQIRELQHILDETIRQARTLTFDLSPPILYELGFEPAVEWLTEQLQERYGVQMSCEDDLQSKPLDEDVRIVLFQAIRELLFNIVKHARARHVDVSLRREGDRIQVRVSDDGIGFDTSRLEEPGKREKGFGLFNIRERLDRLQGQMSLSSEPGVGTEVVLVAPLKHDEEEGKERPR